MPAPRLLANGLRTVRALRFYGRTCLNAQQIQAFRSRGTPIDRLVLRNGMSIGFPAEDADNIRYALDLFERIWHDEVYTRRVAMEPKVVVDIGAHAGFFTLFARSIWPGATIHSFEPEPRNAKLLVENVWSNNLVDEVHTQPQAVAASRGEAVLYLNRISGLHSTHRDGEWAIGSTPVTTADLTDVVGVAGGKIDLLKISCRGAEWDFLRNREDLLRDYVGNVAMEYLAPPGSGKSYLSQLQRIFEQAGFRCVSTPPDAAGCGMLYANSRPLR